MNKRLIIIGFGIIAVLLLWSVASIYPDWLWFGQLGFSPVFWTMLLSRFGFGFLVWLLLILMICVNLYAAKRLHPGEGRGAALKAAYSHLSQRGLSERAANLLLIAFILVLSFVIASRGSYQWDMLLRYLYQEPFGSTDPIFNRDIGFYLFSLPFYIVVRNGLLVLMMWAVLITIGWYMKNGAVQIEGEFNQAEGVPTSVPKITIAPKVKKHLIFLAGIFVLLVAWGYYLKIYGLLYSTQGPAFGASYTDVHVKVLAYKVLIVVSFGFAVVLFLGAFRFKMKLIWLSGGIWIGAVLVLATLLPMLVQKLVVKPNELAWLSPMN
jgi:uncharacterized membrane protein (UPF0182 family)